MPSQLLRRWTSFLAILCFLLALLYVAQQVRPSILLFRYNPYAIPSLVAFLANSGLLYYILRVRTKVSATYLYSIFLLTLVLWSGSEFLQRLSATPEGALFWSTAASVDWSLLPIAMLVFTLSYINKGEWLRNPVLYIFLIISGLGILYLNLTTDAFIPFTQSQLDVQPWGYNSGVERFFPLFLIWFEGMYLSSIILLYLYFRRSTQKEKRQQSLLFMIGVLIPLVGGSLTDGLLPVFGITLYPFAVSLTTINAAITTFAILKYGLLVFNPATLAPNILQTMEEGLIVVSPTYVIEYANARALELLKYSIEDLLGKSIETLFPSSYPLIKRRVFSVLGEQRFAHLAKSEVMTAGQKTVPVSISAARVTDESGWVKGYILTLTDITKLEASLSTLQEKVYKIREQNSDLAKLSQQLEEEKAGVSRKVTERTRELNRSHAQLMASINSLELGFIMINKQLEIVVMNESVARTLSELNLKGKDHPHRTIHQEDSLVDVERKFGANLHLMEKARQCIGEQVPVEIKEVAVGGSFFHLYLSPMVMANRVIGAVLLIQNITENKVLDRSREEFFSIASHELRTPLTAILGYASLIKSMYADKMADERLDKMMIGITEGGSRMIRIVNDFLSMSRLEQGKLVLNKDPLDIEALAREALHELEPLAKEKDIELVLNSQSPLPEACGDRDRVKEVLINLIGNALKFTSKGSIAVSLEPHPGTVQVRVHDSGKGIALANQALLFRKFQQAGSSLIARDSSSGTGLGLYISKLMIEGMGGSISLESSVPGQGSTFSFTLPLVQPDIIP